MQQHRGTMIKSSLIEPDGGALVDLMVSEGERGAKITEAESLPKVQTPSVPDRRLTVRSPRPRTPCLHG